MNFKDVENGTIPPYLMRFFKKTGKTINRYSMIKENDKVLLGISGGKDSLLLSLALSIRKKWLPISYDLQAVMINWIEHPITDENRALLFEYFDTLKIPFTIVEENMFSQGFNGEFNCYLCSRNRRRILFSIAEERGIDKIALGHHLDDHIETTIMNLALRGNFESMRADQDFFLGKIHIIRPLIETEESTIRRIAERLELPVVKSVCPFDQVNIRSKIKPIVKSIAALDKNAKEHIYEAVLKIQDK